MRVSSSVHSDKDLHPGLEDQAIAGAQIRGLDKKGPGSGQGGGECKTGCKEPDRRQILRPLLRIIFTWRKPKADE